MWRSTLDVYVFMVWIGIMHVKQASRIQIHEVNSCEDLQNPQTSLNLGWLHNFLIVAAQRPDYRNSTVNGADFGNQTGTVDFSFSVQFHLLLPFYVSHHLFTFRIGTLGMARLQGYSPMTKTLILRNNLVFS